MIYKLGRISIGEGMALIAMLTLPNIYLSEPSITIGFVGGSAWLVKLLGAIASLALFCSLLYMYKNYINRAHGGTLIEFYQFAEELIGRKVAAVLFVSWALMFELQTVLTLREFADYIVITTLTSSKLALIILLLAACMTVIIYYGLEVVLRVAYILFVIAGVGICMLILLLVVYFDPDYLFPWQGYGLMPILQHSYSDIGTWFPGIAVMAVVPALDNIGTARRAIAYGLGYAMVLKIVLTLAALMLFGNIIASERALLFYEMVQVVNLSQYLQRIDAVFVVIWLTGGLMSAILLQFFTLQFLCRPFKINDINILIPLATLMSAVLAMLPDSVVQAIVLNQFFTYTVATLFMILNTVVFGIGYFIRGRGKRPCAGDIK